MKACVCRNISDKDYSTEEQLKQRLEQDDACCSKCVDHYDRAREVRERKRKTGRSSK